MDKSAHHSIEPETDGSLTCDDHLVDTVPRPLDDPVRLAQLVGESLTRLARITGELATADTIDSVVKIVTYHVADAVGATIAALALREGENARIIGLRGLPAGEAEQWELPLARAMTTTDVIRSGRRLVLVGATAIAQAYPGLPGVDRGQRTVVTLPLRAGGRTIGAIHLSLPGGLTPDPTELDFLDIMADTCAQAFERIEASAVARRQTARLAFLAEASIELAQQPGPRRHDQPGGPAGRAHFADWCAIDVVRDGRVHRLAVAHADPRRWSSPSPSQERWPPDPDSPTGAWAVARTGQPELIREITDEMLVAGGPRPRAAAIARELQLRSALLVPLWVRGRVTGCSPGSPPTSSASTTRRRPLRRAPRPPGAPPPSTTPSSTARPARRPSSCSTPCCPRRWWVPTGGRFLPLPAVGAAEVGGDFYDAVALGDGRYVVFIGDVMGRGVAAAAAMAEMRAATRAFASLDPDRRRCSRSSTPW